MLTGRIWVPWLAAAALFAAMPAKAAVIESTTTFDFTAQCDDCAGSLGDNDYQTVTGTLVLSNFVADQDLTSDNFVSFTYDGSSLVNGFTVETEDLFSFTARLDGDGGILQPLLLLWNNAGFSTCSDPTSICGLTIQADTEGSWVLSDQTVNRDVGIGASFAVAQDVPAPASLVLLATALVGYGAARRRRRDGWTGGLTAASPGRAG